MGFETLFKDDYIDISLYHKDTYKLQIKSETRGNVMVPSEYLLNTSTIRNYINAKHISPL